MNKLKLLAGVFLFSGVAKADPVDYSRFQEVLGAVALKSGRFFPAAITNNCVYINSSWVTKDSPAALPGGNGYAATTDTYYISGKATTLDENGNGQWNGSTYRNGKITQ